jgi:hypothetical protein
MSSQWLGRANISIVWRMSRYVHTVLAVLGKLFTDLVQHVLCDLASLAGGYFKSVSDC